MMNKSNFQESIAILWSSHEDFIVSCQSEESLPSYMIIEGLLIMMLTMEPRSVNMLLCAFFIFMCIPRSTYY